MLFCHFIYQQPQECVLGGLFGFLLLCRIVVSYLFYFKKVLACS